MFSEYYAEPVDGPASDPNESVRPSRLTATEAPLEVTTFEDLEAPTVPPSAVPKRRKAQAPNSAGNNEDDNTEDRVRTLTDRYVSAYNSFFPIILGGYTNSKLRSSDLEEGTYPRGATAIANSYSTGEGGVASSHATAFADPSLRTMLKNGYFNQKTGRVLKS